MFVCRGGGESGSEVLLFLLGERGGGVEDGDCKVVSLSLLVSPIAILMWSCTRGRVCRCGNGWKRAQAGWARRDTGARENDGRRPGWARPLTRNSVREREHAPLSLSQRTNTHIHKPNMSGAAAPGPSGTTTTVAVGGQAQAQEGCAPPAPAAGLSTSGVPGKGGEGRRTRSAHRSVSPC